MLGVTHQANTVCHKTVSMITHAQFYFVNHKLLAYGHKTHITMGMRILPSRVAVNILTSDVPLSNGFTRPPPLPRSRLLHHNVIMLDIFFHLEEQKF